MQIFYSVFIIKLCLIMLIQFKKKYIFNSVDTETGLIGKNTITYIKPKLFDVHGNTYKTSCRCFRYI